jgi:hypothetical protein
MVKLAEWADRKVDEKGLVGLVISDGMMRVSRVLKEKKEVIAFCQVAAMEVKDCYAFLEGMVKSVCLKGDFPVGFRNFRNGFIRTVSKVVEMLKTPEGFEGIFERFGGFPFVEWFVKEAKWFSTQCYVLQVSTKEVGSIAALYWRLARLMEVVEEHWLKNDLKQRIFDFLSEAGMYIFRKVIGLFWWEVIPEVSMEEIDEGPLVYDDSWRPMVLDMDDDIDEIRGYKEWNSGITLMEDKWVKMIDCPNWHTDRSINLEKTPRVCERMTADKNFNIGRRSGMENFCFLILIRIEGNDLIVLPEVKGIDLMCCTFSLLGRLLKERAFVLWISTRRIKNFDLCFWVCSGLVIACFMWLVWIGFLADTELRYSFEVCSVVAGFSILLLWFKDKSGWDVTDGLLIDFTDGLGEYSPIGRSGQGIKRTVIPFSWTFGKGSGSTSIWVMVNGECGKFGWLGSAIEEAVGLERNFCVKLILLIMRQDTEWMMNNFIRL